MTPKTAFTMGWFVSRALSSAATAVAMKNNKLGADIRAKLVGKLDYERLLLLEETIDNEIVRRTTSRKHEDADRRRSTGGSLH